MKISIDECKILSIYLPHITGDSPAWKTDEVIAHSTLFDRIHREAEWIKIENIEGELTQESLPPADLLVELKIGGETFKGILATPTQNTVAMHTFATRRRFREENEQGPSFAFYDENKTACYQWKYVNYWRTIK